MEALHPRRDDRSRNFDFDLDQLLLELVLNTHPEWRCPDCWRAIRRLRRSSDRFELLDA